MQLAKAPNTASTANVASLTSILRSINPLIYVIIALYLILPLLSDRFLAFNNQMNIMRQAAVYLIIAVGQTFVISSRGIDLSVGSMVGLVGCVMATLIKDMGMPVYPAIFLAVLMGTALGSINGLIITKLAVSPLIATLGMLVTLRGLVHLYMGSNFVVRLPQSLVFLGQGTIGPFPTPVLISLAIAFAVWFLYHYTRFGRYTVAVGSNEAACRLAGINVDLYKIMIYAFQGALVGLAAAVLVGRLNSASPGLGDGYELHIIAAVVLGGNALYGGMGTIWGTILGVYLIGIIENGMLLAGASFHTQEVLIGLLLVAAVAYQGQRRRQRGALEQDSP